MGVSATVDLAVINLWVLLQIFFFPQSSLCVVYANLKFKHTDDLS